MKWRYHVQVEILERLLKNYIHSKKVFVSEEVYRAYRIRISIDYENFQIFNNVSRNYTNGMIADLNDTEHFENLERIYHGGMFLV